MSVPESAGIAPSASEPEEAAAMVADDYTDIAVEAPVGRPFSMNLEALPYPTCGTGCLLSCRIGEFPWNHSARDTIERALASTVPLANRVVREGRDLGIGGLLISAPASPTRPLSPNRLVHARFGPLGSLHLRPPGVTGGRGARPRVRIRCRPRPTTAQRTCTIKGGCGPRRGRREPKPTHPDGGAVEIVCHA